MVLAGYLLRCLYRRRVAVLHADRGARLFRQRHLHRRRAVHGGDLAGPAARQRHGPQLRRRQLRQVPRAARAGADHGRGRYDQAAAPNLAMLGPALVYFAAWYILGIIGFWVFGSSPRAAPSTRSTAGTTRRRRPLPRNSGIRRVGPSTRWRGLVPRPFWQARCPCGILVTGLVARGVDWPAACIAFTVQNCGSGQNH